MRLIISLLIAASFISSLTTFVFAGSVDTTSNPECAGDPALPVGQVDAQGRRGIKGKIVMKLEKGGTVKEECVADGTARAISFISEDGNETVLVPGEKGTVPPGQNPSQDTTWDLSEETGSTLPPSNLPPPGDRRLDDVYETQSPPYDDHPATTEDDQQSVGVSDHSAPLSSLTPVVPLEFLNTDRGAMGNATEITGEIDVKTGSLISHYDDSWNGNEIQTVTQRLDGSMTIERYARNWDGVIMGTYTLDYAPDGTLSRADWNTTNGPVRFETGGS